MKKIIKYQVIFTIISLIIIFFQPKPLESCCYIYENCYSQYFPLLICWACKVPGGKNCNYGDCGHKCTPQNGNHPMCCCNSMVYGCICGCSPGLCYCPGDSNDKKNNFNNLNKNYDNSKTCNCHEK